MRAGAVACTFTNTTARSSSTRSDTCGHPQLFDFNAELDAGLPRLPVAHATTPSTPTTRTWHRVPASETVPAGCRQTARPASTATPRPTSTCRRRDGDLHVHGRVSYAVHRRPGHDPALTRSSSTSTPARTRGLRLRAARRVHALQQRPARFMAALLGLRDRARRLDLTSARPAPTANTVTIIDLAAGETVTYRFTNTNRTPSSSTRSRSAVTAAFDFDAPDAAGPPAHRCDRALGQRVTARLRGSGYSLRDRAGGPDRSRARPADHRRPPSTRRSASPPARP